MARSVCDNLFPHSHRDRGSADSFGDHSINYIPLVLNAKKEKLQYASIVVRVNGFL